MKRRVIIWLVLLVCSPLAKAQQWSDDDTRSRSNFGLALGAGFSGMFGGELKNPRPLLGFNSCLFLHGKDTNRRLNWQTGAGIRFRGGNFANGDSGNTAYTRIGLISTDLPLLLNYRLGRPGHGYYKCLQFGVVGSFFLKSIVYQGYDKIPAQRENYLKTWKNLPLKPYDLQAVIGYQKRGQIVGWQMGFKLGIMNINQNFYLKDMIPVTGTGKKIATWNLDFSFLF